MHIKGNIFNKMDQELKHPEKDRKGLQIKHDRKYEDRFNLNASNIIQGVWNYIDEEIKAS